MTGHTFSFRPVRDDRRLNSFAMPQPRSPRTRPQRLSFLQRITALSLLGGIPGLAVALIILWSGSFSARTQWTLTVAMVAFWLAVAAALRRRVEVPLQTLSNLLASLREGDYSFLARRLPGGDALSELMREANALTGLLRDQRLGALEATALLRKVMEEIDVAVFAFDEQERLRLVNRSGEQLLGQPAERLLGATASELGLERCLWGEPRRVERGLSLGTSSAADGATRWGISRSSFRQAGLPLQLLVMTDLRRALREEELEAWQRLVRVLGHEINNSLAPIKSMAGSLEKLMRKTPRPEDWEEDLERGLRVIGGRAEALGRFTGAYASLAKLPKPNLQRVEIGACVRRAVAMETRLAVALSPGPEIAIEADPDQLEQLLINLVRNAADASLETGGEVTAAWAKLGANLEIRIEDCGPGIANPGNLFVPFFTTKPGGVGIGLVLSRQIAEAHGGTLSLENRRSRTGAVARLTLPVRAEAGRG